MDDSGPSCNDYGGSVMERVRTVSGTGEVYVDSNDVGHCAFEINVYMDAEGRVSGRGHVMGDSTVLGKISSGQHVEIDKSDEGKRFTLFAGGWSPGDRRVDVETGSDITH
jgi:hypothetical protein